MQSLSLERNILLKMEQSTRVNGLVILDMDLECKFGQMEQNMKANGSGTRLKEEESFGTQMETYLTESGKLIKLMDLAHILTLTGPSMKENG